MENMIALLQIVGIIAAILFLALFVIIAWMKREFDDELFNDDYLDDIYEGRKEGTE